MNLQTVCNQNKHMYIASVEEDDFQVYGRIIENVDLQEVGNEVERYENFSDGENHYIPSVSQIERLASIKNLSAQIYGGLAVQAGIICTGMNKVLNGIEYHQGSETILTITDCLLFLGKREELKKNRYDLSKVKAFYAKKDQVIELYSTTLHYTPCTVDDKPFLTVVLLLKGTNEKINNFDELLRKKNKWFLTHPSVKNKIMDGNLPGLIGEIPYIR